MIDYSEKPKEWIEFQNRVKEANKQRDMLGVLIVITNRIKVKIENKK